MGCARCTVAPLNVHRTSLYYRLAGLTELTGLDLNEGE
jgi:DNA-binding PucR family transcriptional regulator